MLEGTQRRNCVKGLHITLPSVKPLVAYPVGQGERQAGATLICKPNDMLFSPLRQHILDYKPPRGFVILAFTTFDGSIDPYDHMLHYNQVMILNVGNDRLLCKVFPNSLWGPALAWFH